MLPLRDDNPTKHIPFVTLAIIVLNVLAFILWEPIGGTEGEQAQFFYCNALVPFEVVHQESLTEAGPEAGAQGEDIVQGLQLDRACPHKSWVFSVFASMFLHAGWLHIAGNMLFLWVFGNNVEDKIGPFLYLPFYLAAGIAATAAQLAVSNTGQSALVPNLGASGAVAGVLGAYLLMFPRRRVLTLIIFFFITAIYLPAFVVLGLWFVLQLFSGVAGLSDRVASGGGVAFFAHIGGFVFGALLALLFFPKEGFAGRPPPPRPDFLGARGRRRGMGGLGGRRRGGFGMRRHQPGVGSPWE